MLENVLRLSACRLDAHEVVYRLRGFLRNRRHRSHSWDFLLFWVSQWGCGLRSHGVRQAIVGVVGDLAILHSRRGNFERIGAWLVISVVGSGVPLDSPKYEEHQCHT